MPAFSTASAGSTGHLRALGALKPGADPVQRGGDAQAITGGKIGRSLTPSKVPRALPQPDLPSTASVVGRRAQSGAVGRGVQ